MKNGQSASKPLIENSYEEGSEIISRKESRLERYLTETPDIVIESLFTKVKIDNKSCIYCIFSKSKMMPYIGSTICSRKRLYEHGRKLKSNTHHAKYLQRVFNKYTSRDIFFFILEELSPDSLSERELFWINYFDSVNSGFNATDDTQRLFINEDIKKRIKEKNSKAILMFSTEGELIKEFISVKDAAKYVGASSTNISGCCNGKHRIIKGRVFRYKKDFEKFELRLHCGNGKSQKRLDKTSRKVICEGIIYNSISEAERINNIAKSVLSHNLKYNIPYKGRLFQYYEDMIQPSTKVEE